MGRQWIAVVVGVVWVFCAPAGQCAAGAVWLAAQVQSNGAVGSAGIAAAYPATAAALLAWEGVGRATGAAAGAARHYLDSETPPGFQSLALKILADATAGRDAAPLVSRLLAYQGAGGAFGTDTAHGGNALDTALALRALATAGDRSGAAPAAADALAAMQQGGGSWPGPAGTPSVYVTALATAALARCRDCPGVAGALDQARAYLLARRDAAGRWGEDFQSALVLAALVQTPADAARLGDSIAALRARQAADGSWDEDVYTTAVVLLALHQVEQPPAAGMISGRVLDGDSRLPLGGVAVTLSGPQDRNALTGPDGRFSFAALPAGDYAVALALSGYTGVTSATTVTRGGVSGLGTVRLLGRTDAAVGTVTGAVTAAPGGTPLPGATVTVAGGGTAVTDAAGRYVVAGVPPGVHTVTVAKAGYSAAAVTAQIAAAGVVVFSSALTPVTVPTTALMGTVTDAAGAPLGGVQLNVTGAADAAAVTDAQGAYRLVGLAPGAVTVTAALAGYDSVSTPVTVVAGAVTTVSPRLYAAGTSPADANSQALRGVVIDAVTAAPISGASIAADFGGAGRAAAPGPGGEFLLTGIDASRGTLHISAPGHAARDLAVVLPPLTTLNLGAIRLRPSDVMELLPNLAVTAVDRGAAVNDAATLALSGSLTATIANTGTAAVDVAPDVIAFYDADHDGAYRAGVDVLLGHVSAALPLAPGDAHEITVTLAGAVPYRDAPITVAVDSAMIIAESDETDNTRKSTPVCEGGAAVPSGIEVAPGYRAQVYATAVTAQSGPSALALDSAGNVYFTGGDTGAAFRIPAAGGAPVPFGAATITDTDGLAIDARDDVIVAGNPVTEFAPDQSVLWSHPCLIGNIQSAAVDGDGNVYVGSLGTAICKIGPDGAGVAVFGGFKQPSNPAIGPDGDLYVSEYGARDIVRVDPTTGVRLGVVVRDISATQLAFAADGRLLAGDYDSGDVVAIDPRSGALTTIAAGFPGPQALAVSADPNGDIYVGDVIDKALYRISPAGSIPDLTAGRLAVLDNGFGRAAGVSLRVGNAGGMAVAAGAGVAFYAGDPAAGGALLGTLTLDALPADSWRDVQLDGLSGIAAAGQVFAVVDPDGRVAECNRRNNAIHVAVPASGRADITVTARDAAVAPHGSAAFSAAVRNAGLLPGAFQVQLEVQDATGRPVSDLGTVQTATLPGGDSASVSASWDSGDTLAGDYLIRGVVSRLDGTVIASATSPFAVHRPAAAGPPASLRIAVTRPVYSPNDRVEESILVKNTTSSTMIDGALLHITVSGPAGEPVSDRSLTVAQLAPRARHAYQVDLPLTGAAPGRYAVMAALHDAAGATLAAASGSFAVQDGAAGGLSGRVSAQRASLYQGETQICTAALTNDGAAIADRPLHLSLVNMASGDVLAVRDTRISLDAGDDAAQVQSVDTTALAPAEYACVWSTQDAGQWAMLGYAPFSLLQPPIRIDARLSIGPRGRLLVFMPLAGDRGGDRDADDDLVADGDTALRARLRGVLAGRGWQYTVTADAVDFAAALRSGAYAGFAVVNAPELPRRLAKELREAVFRGAGLVVMGRYGWAHDPLAAALGIRFTDDGDMSARGVTLVDSPLAPAGPLSLDRPVHGVPIHLAGATSAAVYDGAAAAGRREREHRTAVSYFNYGDGRAIYAGVGPSVRDGVAMQAALDGLLADALAWAAPSPPPTVAGDVVPIRLELDNRGIAVSGQVTMTLPAGMEIYDPATATADAAGAWGWPFTLAVGGSDRRVLWARLPAAGNVRLTAHVATDAAADRVPYAAVDLVIPVQATPTLDEAAALLPPGGIPAAGAARCIWLAQGALRLGAPALALHLLLQAADWMDRMPGGIAHDARLGVDYAIRDIERTLPPDPDRAAEESDEP